MINLKQWTTEELFVYCIKSGIIYKMDDYDNWKNDRELMIYKITKIDK